MKELTGAELRKFVMTATQDEIYQYWVEVLAPKYGYTRLVSPTGKVIIDLKKEITWKTKKTKQQ